MAKNLGVTLGGGLPEPQARVKALSRTEIEYEKFVLRSTSFQQISSSGPLINPGQEHLYKLTIAELLFNFETATGVVDGIAYPSLATDQRNANIALPPRSFHRIYEPVACERLTIAAIRQPFGFALNEQLIAKGISGSTIER